MLALPSVVPAEGPSVPQRIWEVALGQPPPVAVGEDSAEARLDQRIEASLRWLRNRASEHTGWGPGVREAITPAMLARAIMRLHGGPQTQIEPRVARRVERYASDAAGPLLGFVAASSLFLSAHSAHKFHRLECTTRQSLSSCEQDTLFVFHRYFEALIRNRFHRFMKRFRM